MGQLLVGLGAALAVVATVFALVGVPRLIDTYTALSGTVTIPPGFSHEVDLDAGETVSLWATDTLAATSECAVSGPSGTDRIGSGGDSSTFTIGDETFDWIGDHTAATAGPYAFECDSTFVLAETEGSQLLSTFAVIGAVFAGLGALGALLAGAVLWFLNRASRRRVWYPS